MTNFDHILGKFFAEFVSKEPWLNIWRRYGHNDTSPAAEREQE